MSNIRIDRRTLLKAAGAALPLLSSLAPRRARGADPVFPKRLLIFFHPNGTIPGVWFPEAGASETEFTLGPIHQPLQAYKSDLIFFSGIDLDSAETGPGEPHQRGMGSVLTGSNLQPGSFVGGDGSLAGWGNGISVDQEIAGAIGSTTRFASLQLGVRALGAEVRHRLSYSAPARPLPPQNSPRDVFDQLFAGFQRTPDEVERLRRARRSVLDAVKKQFVGLRPRISAADRSKLDAHLELVRDMERRLDVFTSAGAACQVPDEPPPIDPDSETEMHVLARLQADLLITAMACDLTRVGSIQCSNGANNIRFSFMQSYTDDHQLSHAGAADTTSRAEWVTRQRWYAEQFAYLLGRLKSIPEGGGSMLDHTAVLWISEISDGNTHSQKNMPFVLAGKCGGYFRTGRYLRYANRRHNDLLLALLAAMGVPRMTFGDPAYCRGILPGLT